MQATELGYGQVDHFFPTLTYPAILKGVICIRLGRKSRYTRLKVTYIFTRADNYMVVSIKVFEDT